MIITIPFTPFATPIPKRKQTINITPNADRARSFQAHLRKRPWVMAQERSAKKFMRQAAYDSAAQVWTGVSEAQRELYSGTVVLHVRMAHLKSARRDQDNALAGLKHAIDGIADAIGIDDNNIQLGGLEFLKDTETYTEFKLETRYG